jgi:hypothetical protein
MDRIVFSHSQEAVVGELLKLHCSRNWHHSFIRYVLAEA